MASNWYVSSVAYAAITPWAATTAYTVGQIIRPTAAVAGKKIAYRCTTGGTTTGVEPTWGLALGGTTTNGAVFTAINSDTYGWAGAAGDISTVTNVLTVSFAAAGDKIFLSSDHSETTAATTNWMNSISGSWTAVTTFILSVNRGGSVPPVAADLTPGASITYQTLYLDSSKPVYIQGVTFIASSGGVIFGNAAYGSFYLKTCSLQITGASSGSKISSLAAAEVTLDDTSISFANSGQSIGGSYPIDFTWVNTASPLVGTAPNNLFITSGNAETLIVWS